MTGEALRALPYLGGKSSSSNQGTGRWIASLLPQEREVCYVEPFAGMLGVLLQRPRATYEIANDLDGRIVNWWRVMRDRPDDLLAKLACTPNARAEYEAQLGRLNDPDPLVQALAVSVVIEQSVTGALASTPSSWRRKFIIKHGGRQSWAGRIASLERVAARIRDVQFECCDATELLARTADMTDVVVYADPPYPSAAASHKYGGDVLDRAALTEVLSQHRGRVAVSGYGAEWDHLGFVRHEHATMSSALGNVTSGTQVPKTEVLWTNYQPITQGTLL